MASLLIHYDLIALLALVVADISYLLFRFGDWTNKIIIRSILFFEAALIVIFIGPVAVTGQRTATFYRFFVVEVLFCSLFFIIVLTTIQK